MCLKLVFEGERRAKADRARLVSNANVENDEAAPIKGAYTFCAQLQSEALGDLEGEVYANAASHPHLRTRARLRDAKTDTVQAPDIDANTWPELESPRRPDVASAQRARDEIEFATGGGGGDGRGCWGEPDKTRLEAKVIHEERGAYASAERRVRQLASIDCTNSR